MYNEAELQNIFTLFDLKGEGTISKDQCIQGKLNSLNLKALKTLANSEFHFAETEKAKIGDKVDLFTFMKLCDEVLGIKPK